MPKSNILDFLEHIIEKIDNLRIKPLFLILAFSLSISLREILEQWFFEESFSIYQFMHHFYFYSILMAGILVISYVGRIAIQKVTKIASLGLFLIVLPPLIDRFVFGRAVPYEYILPKNLIEQFSSMFLFSPHAGKGILIELGAILILSGIYVWIKSRSLLRSILCCLALYILMGLAATPRIFLPIPDLSESVFFHSRHLIYFFYLFLLTLLWGILFLYRIHPRFPSALLKEILSFRTLHAILMVNVGLYFNPALKFQYFPDILYIFVATALMALLWLNAVLINNVYDLAIDKITNLDRPLVRNAVRPNLYLGLSAVLSVLIPLTSLVLGVLPSIIALLSILSALAYSAPPLRLRRYIFSTIFIGWGSLLAFSYGFFCHSDLNTIFLPRNIWQIGALIFVVFSIGPLTTDMKDYEGDRDQGVRSIFSVYGLEKGLKIVAVFLGLSLLMPLILFHTRIDTIIIPNVAIVTSFLFYFQKNHNLAFIGYGIIMAYCILRILEKL